MSELGAQITKDFAGQSVILVGVLKGLRFFSPTWRGNVDLDATFDFIGVSSYGNRPTPARNSERMGLDRRSEADQRRRSEHEGQEIILVEDILDTGLTMTYLKKLLWRASRDA